MNSIQIQNQQPTQVTSPTSVTSAQGKITASMFQNTDFPFTGLTDNTRYMSFDADGNPESRTHQFRD